MYGLFDVKSHRAGRARIASENRSASVISKETGQNLMTESNLIGRRAVVLSLAAFTALAFIAGVPFAHAASLDDLRAQGAVGERFDGLAVARDGSAKDFVKDVNAKRSQIYQREAKKTGADVTAVGKIFAKQIMGKAPSGTWFLNENNKWVQK
jgi:hypothetical protein